FYSMTGLTSLNLSNFNTSNVTDIYGMCYGMSSLTSLDLSSFDTSSVVRMGGSYTSDGMFSYCTNLQRIYVNASKWNTNAVTSSTYMFYNDTNLVGGAGTTYSSSYTDKTYARIDGGPTSSTPGYLTDIADKP
ncbi:MAG: BspA family leucine-rich repeat surface protein, partial [Bacilli bacterium]|nr:BspA family leucine-rich repeat surface protein [Bacilli bacterium]